MILNELSETYLSSKIDLDNFQTYKETYSQCAQDGHFDEGMSDRALAVLLFSAEYDGELFTTRGELDSFVCACRPATQKKICNEMNVERSQDLVWNLKLSEYLRAQHGLPEHFAYPENTRVTSSAIPGVVRYQISQSPYRRLKDYQSGVFHKTLETLSPPFTRAIMQMPTGGGKTRTAMEVVADFLARGEGDVIWLANTQELVDQAFETFHYTWPHLAKTKVTAVNHVRSSARSVIGSSDINEEQVFHACTIQTLAGITTEDKFERIFGRSRSGIGLVVVDEAHISIAPTYKTALDQMGIAGARILGLTATPGRATREHGATGNIELSEFYQRNLVKMDVPDIAENAAEVNAINYLRSKGILSNARKHSIIGSSVMEGLSAQEIRAMNDGHEIPQKIIRFITNDAFRNATIVDKLIDLLTHDKKTIFFANSIAHSKMICALLRLKGFRVAHIDGGNTGGRKKNIEAFRRGDLQMLSNYGVLSTGFDDPGIQVVFIARATKSIVLYSQMIGRGLRGPAINGTDSCDIYTVIDNIAGLPDNNDIYDYFDSYFIN